MGPLPWHCRGKTLTVGPRPLVMGIVNVTPDSFSDGGRFLEPAVAVEHGLRLAEEGADLLDVGGESTRPGSESIPLEEELRRVVPVVQALATRTGVPISVDTSKAEVARQCLDAGAAIINDVTGLRGDPEMPAVAAEFAAGVVVMHMQGTPATMQQAPRYDDVVRDVGAFFAERLKTLAAAGIAPQSVALDPGIGFGKTQAHTLRLLANLDEYAQLGRPVCLGVSRKGFIGVLTGRDRGARMPGSLAVAVACATRNPAMVLRVHDVGPTRDAAILIEAIESHRDPIPF
ncbi:MAG TPA: dihydropteroate synthase [Fimbriiglobus sp.]|nr:dihydropteroate synthase [Fimbriiglobus sp.]